MPSTKGDRFGTFLERAKHYSSLEATSGETKALPTESKSLDNVLAILIESGPLPAQELTKKAGLGAFEVSKLLDVLVDAQLVVLNDVSGEETVSLTDNGEKVAYIAKQAG